MLKNSLQSAPTVFEKLSFTDVNDILEIEEVAYEHPWTMGNFLDSLHSGYLAFGLRDDGDSERQLLAYFVAMAVVDELHLLNLAVRVERQGQGFARVMLDQLVDYAQGAQFVSILLEVRVSNLRAIAVYARYGFVEIGRRKNYYPALNNTREDAIVMRMEL